MYFIPLPAYDFAKEDSSINENDSFGYFGDYYSHTRNLIPFYKSLQITGIPAYIIGDSNLSLESSEQIQVMPRTTLKELSEYQKKTYALVNLCNLKGGQIPGKIYHYSVTRHPILFILDGTEDEKEQIRFFFSRYQRYTFCENNEDSITKAIKEILNHKGTEEKPVTDFYPKNIIKKLFEEHL